MTIRNSRRFWPLWVALGCWLLVFLVPATRSGLDAAWSNRFGNSAGDFAVATPVDGTPEIREWTRRFPGNKAVEIFAAARFGGGAELVKRHPNDALVITLALREQVNELVSDRNEGPLTNPNYPAPPPNPSLPSAAPSASGNGSVMTRAKLSSRAQLNRFLDLARRGQKLEPNNTFFSWMVIHSLYATRQDEAARAELSKAALQTAYDDHSRDLVLNNLTVLRLAHGAPLSPRDQSLAWSGMLFPGLSNFRKTSRWAMESVIADRQSGRHDRALTDAFNLARLSRVMRREGHWLINSLVGTSCEALALSSVTIPPKTRGVNRPRPGAALSAFQSDPRMLHFYAKSQKRRDITRFLDAEWVELGKWQRGVRAFTTQQQASTSTAQTVTLIAAERFAVLCLRVLPSILVLGALFALLARRFRADASARGVFWRGVFWRGAAFGAALLAAAMLCDAVIVYQSADDSGMMEFNDKYFGGVGLFADLEWWIHLGLAGAVVCFGLNRAVAWQKARRGGQISLLSRLKTTFEAPEDGLARFDFGWIFEIAARVTSWALLLGGTLLFCFQLEGIRTWSEGGLDMGVLALGGALFVSIFLSVAAWHKLPRRRDTLRAVPRFIAGALSGFFVVLSVLYTFVAFAVLPFALQNEARFEKTVRVGEMATARAQVGF